LRKKVSEHGQIVIKSLKWKTDKNQTFFIFLHEFTNGIHSSIKRNDEKGALASFALYKPYRTNIFSSQAIIDVRN